MRIETLLQDPKVREALNRAIADDHWLLRGESSLSEQEARERAEESRVALVTALLAALAGEGEETETCYECGEGCPGWRVEPHPGSGEPMQVECLMCAEVGRRRLPLLARVATLEAEKATVEAERDRLKQAVADAVGDLTEAYGPLADSPTEPGRIVARYLDTLLGETDK